MVLNPVVANSTLIFGRSISLICDRSLDDIVYSIAETRSQAILFCNVHMLMLSREDSRLAQAMDHADWVFADGVPVGWLQRRLTSREAQIIRGYEFMLAACEFAAERGEPVGFLGSTRAVLVRLAENLIKQFPALEVRYSESPAFVATELQSSEAELEAIRASGIRWLFVGLGCPKQEKWIDRNRNALDCHLLGVGAAFDWLAGTTKKPPGWMERAGLAWLFRLGQNPRKMWRRYLIYNSKFVYRSLILLLTQKRQKHPTKSSAGD